jgi:DUF4097 and DUF4098 domain-containing protein YvlB
MHLRIILVSSLLGLTLASACGGSDSGGFVNTRPSAEEPFSFNVARETQTALRLEGISGTVEVTGTPGATSISVAGVRRVEADTLEDATAHLAELDVVVDSSETEVVVRTVQPKLSAGRNYIVNYTISLPQDFAVNVVNVNGDVTVRSVDGDVVVSCVNGQIHADAIAGNAILALVNGQITASVTLPLGGQIDMGLVNGNIDLQIPQTTSAQFAARVGIGSITLTNLSLSNETVTPGSRTGTLGGGDGTISLDVGIGTIAVRGS